MSTIENIVYIPGGTIPEGAKHSQGLAFVNYAQDAYGMNIPKKTPGAREASHNPDLLVRSYYGIQNYKASSAEKGTSLTFESVMQLVAAKRGRIVEAEIAPMSDLIENRNAMLNDIQIWGGRIAATQVQQQKDREASSKNKGTGSCPGLGAFLLTYFTQEELSKVTLHGDYEGKSLYYYANQHSSPTDSCTSTQVDGVVDMCSSLVKAKIDYLNNETQTDMTRLNSLIQKRDESFQTAKELTSIVSDGRGETLQNMGG